MQLTLIRAWAHQVVLGLECVRAGTDRNLPTRVGCLPGPRVGSKMGAAQAGYVSEAPRHSSIRLCRHACSLAYSPPTQQWFLASHAFVSVQRAMEEVSVTAIDIELRELEFGWVMLCSSFRLFLPLHIAMFSEEHLVGRFGELCLLSVGIARCFGKDCLPPIEGGACLPPLLCGNNGWPGASSTHLFDCGMRA